MLQPLAETFTTDKERADKTVPSRGFLMPLLCSALSAFTIAAHAGMQEGLAAYESGDYETAYHEFLPLAEQGNTAAQLKLALMYRDGQGVPQDHAEAVKWFRKSAEQGVVLAQYDLGLMYEQGQGVQQNYEEAVKWYHKAADRGNALAQYQLGTIYESGKGVPQYYAAAMKWYRRAADQGYALAQYELGLMYRKGQGVPLDYVQGYFWLGLTAEKGNHKAQQVMDEIAKLMTPDQIAEARRMTKNWQPKPEGAGRTSITTSGKPSPATK